MKRILFFESKWSQHGHSLLDCKSLRPSWRLNASNKSSPSVGDSGSNHLLNLKLLRSFNKYFRNLDVHSSLPGLTSLRVYAVMVETFPLFPSLSCCPTSTRLDIFTGLFCMTIQPETKMLEMQRDTVMTSFIGCVSVVAWVRWCRAFSFISFHLNDPGFFWCDPTNLILY